MILAPPLWATNAWTADVWADGSWAESAAVPSTFGDLSTLFAAYLASLLETHAGADDVSTQLAAHVETVRGATVTEDDLNTMYCEYLTPRF